MLGWLTAGSDAGTNPYLVGHDLETGATSAEQNALYDGIGDNKVKVTGNGWSLFYIGYDSTTSKFYLQQMPFRKSDKVFTYEIAEARIKPVIRQPSRETHTSDALL